ncbi:MAG: methyltransferase [Planctomycetota bacterium]
MTEGLWHPDMVERYPMDSNAMVHGLDPQRFDLLLTYVEERTLSDRLATMVAEISRQYPSYLRVKELFETIEAYRRIGQHVYEQWRAGRVERILELCAGHGLLGILLANRFPKLDVLCVDAEHRPAFDHTLEVAAGLGVELANLRYVESDIGDVPIPPRSYAIIIHGCNEVTQVALERAVAAGACFAAMPCCIRDGIYLRKINHLDDRQRYAAAVGAIAGQFGADKITAIDERITNRHLIVLGPGR